MLRRAQLCHSMSSVCPSVTFRYSDHIGWNNWKIISRLAIWSNGNANAPPPKWWNRGRVMSTKTCNISETVQDRTKVTMTDYTRFRLVPMSMTLDDLNGRNVTLVEIYGAHQKHLNDDRPVLSAAKCRTMILVSRNIRYMRVFAGVFGGGGVSCQTTISVHACVS